MCVLARADHSVCFHLISFDLCLADGRTLEDLFCQISVRIDLSVRTTASLFRNTMRWEFPQNRAGRFLLRFSTFKSFTHQRVTGDQ